MILNRRGFFQTTLGAASSVWIQPSKHQRQTRPSNQAQRPFRWTNLACDPVLLPYLDCLGRPPSWDVVRQGFWPCAQPRCWSCIRSPEDGRRNRWLPKHVARGTFTWAMICTFGPAETNWQSRSHDEWKRLSKK